MTTLTLSTFDSQLDQANQLLLALEEKIAETKAIKRAIAAKKRLAEKAFNSLNKAIKGINSVIEQLGADGAELQKAAVTAVFEYLPVAKAEPEKPSNLVNFSKKQNDSNEFFTWQPTANDQVSNYFNVARGTIQATYIGSNNKQKLQTVGNKLTEYLEGVSFEVRTAQRLNYKYELKLRGIDDDTLGWLVEFDFNQSFTAQLFNDLGDCPIDSLQGQSVPINLRFESHLIPTNYRIEPSNWLAAKGAVLVDQATGERFHLVSVEPDGVIGTIKGQYGNVRSVYLDLFQFDREFADATNSTLRALLACKTKKELEAIKASRLVEEETLKWIYKNLNLEQKKRIDAICKKQKKAA